MLQPDWDVLFQEWWGGGVQDNCALLPWVAEASNILVGCNPSYQVSDFLAMYTKFGTYPQSIQSASVVVGGTGYQIGDVLTPVQNGGSGATLTVATLGASGAVATVTVSTPGTGYRSGETVPVTGGQGTGATFGFVITPGTFPVIPLVALQSYVALATCCLQKARWGCMWTNAVGLFVAHYVTMWLKSEGNPGTTAAQIATSGLAIGLRTAMAAGDVSESLQYLQSLEEFGAWALTTYGQLLATQARIVGMGPMYIY